MTLDTVFTIATALAGFGWLLLFACPHWQWTKRLIHSGGVSVALSLIYVSVFLWDAYTGAPKSGDFWSLKAVQSLFSHETVVLVGWIHYLAFDLFIGAWLVRDAKRLNIKHWVLLPCLVLTLMLGPFGLLAYFCMRWGLRREWMIETANLRLIEDQGANIERISSQEER
jgi:hypothetical protein